MFNTILANFRFVELPAAISWRAGDWFQKNNGNLTQPIRYLHTVRRPFNP